MIVSFLTGLDQRRRSDRMDTDENDDDLVRGE